MHRSLITVVISGFALIGSVFAALLYGASLNTRAISQASFKLTSSVVSFEPTREVPAMPARPTLDSVAPQRGTGGLFTYQGVLTDINGDAVAGPIELEFLVFADPVGGGARIPISGDFRDVDPDAQGRFQVDVSLPSANLMSGYTNFGLRIRATSDSTPIVDDLPIRPAPYAWLSEYARTSETASFAQSADTAGSASVAGQLTNDQTHTIALSSFFAPSGALGQPPRAVRVGNIVMLTGTMTNVMANPNGAIVGTLPVGMRPANTQAMAVHVSLSTTSGNAAVSVLPNGDIRITSPNYGPGATFFLSGANFIVD